MCVFFLVLCIEPGAFLLLSEVVGDHISFFIRIRRRKAYEVLSLSTVHRIQTSLIPGRGDWCLSDLDI